jgi:hypothetical protein
VTTLLHLELLDGCTEEICRRGGETRLGRRRRAGGGLGGGAALGRMGLGGGGREGIGRRRRARRLGARHRAERGFSRPMDKKWVCGRASAPWTERRPRSRHVSSIGRPKIQSAVRAPWGCSNHTVGFLKSLIRSTMVVSIWMYLDINRIIACS